MWLSLFSGANQVITKSKMTKSVLWRQALFWSIITKTGTEVAHHHICLNDWLIFLMIFTALSRLSDILKISFGILPKGVLVWTSQGWKNFFLWPGTIVPSLVQIRLSKEYPLTGCKNFPCSNSFPFQKLGPKILDITFSNFATFWKRLYSPQVNGTCFLA